MGWRRRISETHNPHGSSGRSAVRSRGPGRVPGQVEVCECGGRFVHVCNVKVSVFPDIRANRYINVQLQILDEDKSVLTNLEVNFDIKKPRKLMHFLRAVGQSCFEDKDFNITPAAWKGKECRVRLVTTEFRKEGEELKERNVIAEFLHQDV